MPHIELGATITAARAPLWYASVKTSEDCDARVELASHEMNAIQGVVATWRLLGSDKETDWIEIVGNDVLVSLAAPVMSSSENCTSAPFPTHKPQHQYTQRKLRAYLGGTIAVFTNNPV